MKYNELERLVKKAGCYDTGDAALLFMRFALTLPFRYPISPTFAQTDKNDMWLSRLTQVCRPQTLNYV